MRVSVANFNLEINTKYSMTMTKAKLIFEDGTELSGNSFGAQKSVNGEIVFATGMVGYPQSMTDPSYRKQILTFTYPIIGSYGVPGQSELESDEIHISALIVSTYHDNPSHYASRMSLGKWLIENDIPALEISDTRYIAKKLRSEGATLGKVLFEPQSTVDFEDPNDLNLVAEVSTKTVEVIGKGSKTIAFIDCGAKRQIIRNFVERGVRIIRVPWDYDVTTLKEKIDGVFISNGPGNPKKIPQTIANVKKLLKTELPIFGICLGNQILTLAAGGDTSKLKFGHRSQNQPCLLAGSKRCYITTQNHGYAVTKIPSGFTQWFTNANDGTNEGIIHKTKPIMSVQFHPESTPGPEDTTWLFDEFLSKI